MKKRLSFLLDNDEEIVVEVEETGGGMERVGRGGDRDVESTGRRFADALAGIRPAAQTVLDTFRELNTPDEINLEFGMTFDAKAGAIFTSVGTAASLKVSLKWKNPKTEGTGA